MNITKTNCLFAFMILFYNVRNQPLPQAPHYIMYKKHAKHTKILITNIITNQNTLQKRAFAHIMCAITHTRTERGRKKIREGVKYRQSTSCATIYFAYLYK